MAYYNPCLVDIIAKLTLHYKRFNLLEIKENVLVNKISLPDDIKFEISYGKLFKILREKFFTIIPLGVQRMPSVAGNDLPYFITNPDLNFPLEVSKNLLIFIFFIR